MSIPLEEIKPVDLQEGFNKVWDTFVVQKKGRAYRGGAVSGCMYIMPPETGHPGCAVGLNIPRKLIPQIERELGTPLSQVWASIRTLCSSKVTPRSATLEELFSGRLADWAEMQTIHDKIAMEMKELDDPEEFAVRIGASLTAFAERHQLTIPA